MATKETMVTAPVLVVLFDRAFYYSSFREAIRDRHRLYLALGATWVVLVAVSWTAPRSASAGFNVGVSPWTYLLNQGPVLTDYLRTAVWPDRFVFTYGEPVPLDFLSAAPFLALIVLLLAATAWAWWRQPSIGVGHYPRHTRKTPGGVTNCRHRQIDADSGDSTRRHT